MTMQVIRRASASEDEAKDNFGAALGCEYAAGARVDMSVLDESGVEEIAVAYVFVHSNDPKFLTALAELIMSGLDSLDDSKSNGNA